MKKQEVKMVHAKQIAVTDQDRKKFNKDGYWISPKIISDNQIERLRNALERVWTGEYDGDSYPIHGIRKPPADPFEIYKMENAWWVNDEVRKAVTNPLIGELATDLIETDEVRLWHDQIITKPGTGTQTSSSGNVGWHQDFGYWQCSDKMNMVTVWIALQDTDLNNGGMMTIAGSHKWGVIPDSDTFFDQDMDSLKEKYAAMGREWKEEPCILKAGQTSFHHALTLHGSGPNQTLSPRLSVVAHLMPEGTAYRPGIQYHTNISLLGPRPYAGQLFDNEYFPLLYSKNKKANCRKCGPSKSPVTFL
jgi:ectoine hydroxylase-related dioxygenase (phytanoyl-CoA dioxygenase family)